MSYVKKNTPTIITREKNVPDGSQIVLNNGAILTMDNFIRRQIKGHYVRTFA